MNLRQEEFRMSRFLFYSCALGLLASCGPKDTTPAAPVVGWHQEEGWSIACYHPPDFNQFNVTERRIARQEALEAIQSQWLGTRQDGISFSESAVDELDTTLLSRPDNIEFVSQKNLEFCKQVAGGADTGSWESWLRGLSAQLTEGVCTTPLDYTMFDYLDIGEGWQRPLGICQGDRVRVSGTSNDKYRIADSGPWINVAGDLDQPALGADLPCNFEGCYQGQLILRFVSSSGVESILPVGEELIFEAPEHGEISYRINDETFYDNTWFQNGSLVDHTSIEVSPAQ